VPFQTSPLTQSACRKETITLATHRFDTPHAEILLQNLLGCNDEPSPKSFQAVEKPCGAKILEEVVMR